MGAIARADLPPGLEELLLQLFPKLGLAFERDKLEQVGRPEEEVGRLVTCVAFLNVDQDHFSFVYMLNRPYRPRDLSYLFRYEVPSVGTDGREFVRFGRRFDRAAAAIPVVHAEPLFMSGAG